MYIESWKQIIIWAWSRFWRWMFIFFILSILVNASPLGRDDSDLPGWGEGRSGATVVKDHLTGCEYLSASGGISARLDSQGKQICR